MNLIRPYGLPHIHVSYMVSNLILSLQYPWALHSSLQGSQHLPLTTLAVWLELTDTQGYNHLLVSTARLPQKS